jgi:DNA uptake protein ComE-like DNA-binding protein
MFAALMVAAALCFAVAAATPQLPLGKGKEIVQRTCSSCHALSAVTLKRASTAQWTQIVNLMITRGAQIPDEEVQTVVDYLAANFNLSSPPPADALRASSGPKLINVNAATAKQLSFAFGLTPEEADAVIEYRAQHGKIKDWVALTKMPGVPASKFRDRKSLIRY